MSRLSRRVWRRIGDGERIPDYQRIAFFQPERREAITVLIGFHLFVRAIRRVWEWTFRYNPSFLERIMRERDAARSQVLRLQENMNNRDRCQEKGLEFLRRKIEALEKERRART